MLLLCKGEVMVSCFFVRNNSIIPEEIEKDEDIYVGTE